MRRARAADGPTLAALRRSDWSPDQRGATALQDITFARAATGRISSVTSAGRPADSRTYTCDDLDRLLSATNAGNTALNQTFAYDTAHNMTSNSAVGAYTYPAQGLGAVRPHAVTAAGTHTLAYDAAGDLVTRSGGGTSSTLLCKLSRVTIRAPAYNLSAELRAEQLSNLLDPFK